MSHIHIDIHELSFSYEKDTPIFDKLTFAVLSLVEVILKV